MDMTFYIEKLRWLERLRSANTPVTLWLNILLIHLKALALERESGIELKANTSLAYFKIIKHMKGLLLQMLKS